MSNFILFEINNNKDLGMGMGMAMKKINKIIDFIYINKNKLEFLLDLK